MNLLHTFTDFCQRHQLQDRHLVLGVSGGMDSMVLLHICIAARNSNPRPFFDFSVVHVNHGLRQKADDDAAFVAAYCRDRNVGCKVVQANVRDMRGEGVEAAARRERYRALCQEAQARQGVCMVAHHRRDQLETFLIRWLRGASLTGLGAMREQSAYRGVPIYRPLLDVDHADMAQYAQESGLPFVVDESNADRRFLRNRLRHDIVPLLTDLQPRLEERTGLLTRLLQSDDDYLQSQAVKALADVVAESADTSSSVLRIDRLKDLHVSLQRRVIHILLNCLSEDEWGYRHIDAVLQLTADGTSPSAFRQLANGVAAWRNYGLLYIGYGTPDEQEGNVRHWRWDVERTRRFRFETSTVKWRFRAFPFRQTRFQASKRSLWHAWLPNVASVEIETGLSTSVRLRPLGLDGSRKLQDLYSDRKIPQALRSAWPAVAIDGEVVWIPGVVRTDAHLVTASASAGWVMFAQAVGHMLRT
ncbi:tRNA lysidine(34) synthetase TilS [Alicyclobacillus acidiphilus]|uniref:tRNA lysidine(34) synthetase TilS n=1 Tax=Alicyclobacillus acidiphilus TaxID=182455 RepID=UPI0014700F38|nr:tRNA lysidine(34) synthetase TilS [Alicyclobacillus acidiphilus]